MNTENRAPNEAGEGRIHGLLDHLRAKPTCSVEEAAEVLGIGRNLAYRAAREGTLPTVRIGKSYRVPTALLLELLGLSAETVTVSVGVQSHAKPAA